MDMKRHLNSLGHTCALMCVLAGACECPAETPEAVDVVGVTRGADGAIAAVTLSGRDGLRTLEAYARDPRGAFAKHAGIVLSGTDR